jgi:LysR family transcriptional regulator, glycine cleavage system transcriptional activator
VQAALDGQGVVLGWKGLVQSLIDAKRLVPVAGHHMPAPQSFYLTWSAKRTLSPEAAILKDWLLKHLT